jgi:hypothetical protein
MTTVNPLHPSEEKVEAVVAPGRTVLAGANAEAAPNDTKVFRPGETVWLYPSDVARLQKLGFLVIPPAAPPAGGEEAPASASLRRRPSLSAKDGPRVERSDAD